MVVNIIFLLLFSLVAMHCLTCKRKSPSSGQLILQMYKKVTPNFLNAFVRAVVLFIVGGFLALFLTVLSMLPESRRRNLGVLPHEVIVNVFSDTWWIPPSCGTAAVVIGLIYPMSDSRIGEPHKIQRDWSSVARCVAIFVGINHACAKITFNSHLQLSLALAVMSTMLWWWFDRSKNGFWLGVICALCASVLLQILIFLGVYRSGEPDFLIARLWIPFLLFAASVTFGNIGRQLAMVDYRSLYSKPFHEHSD